ncbi:MAG: HAD hydrolase-like protein [Candidatus Pacearchaeota archaeon]
MKKYLFDLDNTIADTSEIKIYRKSAEGMEYLAENIDKFNIYYNPKITNLINKLNEKGKISIITNAPLNYAKAILKKGEFSESIPIYSNMKKPIPTKIYFELKRKINPNETIVIGNSPKDIIAAHGYIEDFAGYEWPETFNLPSAGVIFKRENEKIRLKKAIKLNKAEPNKILKNTEDLEELVDEFESGKITYQRRKSIDEYFFISKQELPEKDIKIEIFYLGNYYPKDKFPDMNKKDAFSQHLLRFKRAQDCPIENINDRIIDKYFFNGQIRGIYTYWHSIKFFLEKAEDRIDEMNLKGKTEVIASPNSYPEYCYDTDVNQAFARKLNNDCFNISETKRIVYRVFPKEKHSRGIENHLKTIGIEKTALSHIQTLNNIIIFDDNITSGSQIKAIAYLLRQKCNFQGNIYGLTLGKTVGSMQ